MAKMHSSRVSARPSAKASRVPQLRFARWMEFYAGALIIATLLLSVWPQALFFDYSALIVAGLVLAAGGFVAGQLNRLAFWVLLPWMAQAAGYGLALTGAIDVGAAQEGALLHLSLLTMAAVAWFMAEDMDLSRFFLGFIGYMAALLAYLIPLTTSHLIQAFNGVLFTDRWASVFQYPDTAGAVFGAGWMALLAYRPRGAWERQVARGAMIIDGAALLLSLSRGADLVMPIALLALLVVEARRGNWTRLINPMIGGGVGGLLLSLIWRGHLPGLSWGPLLFLGLAAVMVALWWCLEWGADRLVLSARQWRLAGAGIIVLVLIGAAFYLTHKMAEPVADAPHSPYAIAFVPASGSTIHVDASAPVKVTLVGQSRYDAPTSLKTVSFAASGSVAVPALKSGLVAEKITVTPKAGDSVALRHLTMSGANGTQNLLPWYVHVLPASLYTRLLEVNGRQLSVWQRAVFVGDGIRMASQRPILGYGAGGWGAGYHAFESLPYTSSEVHNGWVQWWVDGGGLAGLAFAGLMAGVLYAAWKARRLPDDLRILAAGLIAVNVVLIGHSVVDWDLSFFWVELLVASAWAVMMRVSLGRTDMADNRPRGWMTWVAGALALTAALFSFIFAQGQGYANAATRAAQKNKLTQALQSVKKAVAATPTLGSAEQLYAEIDANLSTQKNSGVAAPTVLALFRRTLELIPNSAPVRDSYGNYLIAAGQPATAVPQFVKAVNLAPMQQQVVAGSLQGLYNVIVGGLSQSQKSTVSAGISGLHQVLARYRAAQKEIPAGMVPSLNLPNLSGSAALAVGVDELTHGQITRARQQFSSLPQGQLANTGKAWLEVMQLTTQSSAAMAKAGALGTVAHNLVSYHLVK